LGHSRPCPSLPVVLAPAGGCAPSTLRVCARGGGLWRPPRRPSPPQRRHPIAPPGSGDGHAAAAPPVDGAGVLGRAHPEPPPAPRRRAYAHGRGGSGAPLPPRTLGRDADGGSVGAQRRGRRRRRAPRRRWGCGGFPLAQRTWERVRTGWGGVQSPARSSRWSVVHSRGLCGGNCARAIVRGSRGGRPVVWVRKGWEIDKKAVLVWRDSGVGVGGIVSEQRCLLSEHLQKMHVTLLSLFGRVKTVLSFRKSRVFSRTRFQSRVMIK